jgi:hypothetical protein
LKTWHISARTNYITTYLRFATGKELLMPNRAAIYAYYART